MAANRNIALSVIIQAVDKVTAPLRAINERIKRITAPFQAIGNKFASLYSESGLPRLVTAFSSVGSAVGGVIKEVGALAAKITGVTALAAAGLFGIVNAATESGDATAKLAKRLKLTVDEFMSLQFAAEGAGISQEEFASAMDYFNKTMGAAKADTGPLVGLLKKVSPEFLRQMKAAKGNGAALDLMFGALARLEDPNKRATLAAAAFGRSAGAKMANMVEDGTASIAEMREEYLRLVGSQQKFTDGAEAQDDAMDALNATLTGVRNTVMAELFPAFTILTKSLTEFLVANRERIREWAANFARDLPARITALIQGIRDLAASLQQFAAIGARVVEFFGGFKVLLAAIAVIIGGQVILAIYNLATAFAALGIAMLTTPIGWILGGLALLAGAAALVIRYWEPITGFFKKLGDDIRYFVGEGIDWVLAKIKAMGEFLRNPFGSIGGFLSGVLAPVKASRESGGGPLNIGQYPSILRRNSEARVVVDFNNMPRGATVTPDPRGTAPLDLDVGYSMQGAN